MNRSTISLKLSTLKDLDSRIEKLVDDQITRAVRDCKERPELEKARLVKIQIEVVPILEDGICDDVNVQIFVDDKHPPRRTRAYRLGTKRDNSLFFALDNPEDIRQQGLYDGDDK